MIVFSFNLVYGGHKTWIEGTVAKQEDGSFVAASAVFPEFSAAGATVHQAVKGFKAQLPVQLDNWPDARVALEAQRSRTQVESPQ